MRPRVWEWVWGRAGLPAAGSGAALDERDRILVSSGECDKVSWFSNSTRFLGRSSTTTSRPGPPRPWRRVLARSHCYTSMAADLGHLSPWTTWPTLHRGVNDEQHMIASFGEDRRRADRQFPPIWTLLRAAGASVGVCGTLHSYPAPDDTGPLRVLPARRIRLRARGASAGARGLPAVQPRHVTGVGAQCRHPHRQEGRPRGGPAQPPAGDSPDDLRRPREAVTGRAAPAGNEQSSPDLSVGARCSTSSPANCSGHGRSSARSSPIMSRPRCTAIGRPIVLRTTSGWG